MVRTKSITALIPYDGTRSNAAGPNVDEIQIPYFVSQIDATFDWNYTTVAQGALQNRTIPYPRGHVLGGSTSTSTCWEMLAYPRTLAEPSSTDFMFYTRGSSDEFDKLARVSGDDGWSWKQILPYILKVNPNTSHEWQGTMLTVPTDRNAIATSGRTQHGGTSRRATTREVGARPHESTGERECSRFASNPNHFAAPRVSLQSRHELR